MTRLLVAVALLAVPAVASAQDGTPLPPGSSLFIGPPVIGNRVVAGPPITNGASALFPAQMVVPPRFSVGGGSMSAYPQVWLPSGAWGGVNYMWPVYPVYVEYGPAPAQATSVLRGVTVRPQPGASASMNATLVVEFPAAAEIWVGGKKSEGDPATEWTLTSPLGTGASHTFEVKGRWKAGGKTFEASRSVSVAASNRNRLIVATGTEVK